MRFEKIFKRALPNNPKKMAQPIQENKPGHPPWAGRGVFRPFRGFLQLTPPARRTPARYSPASKPTIQPTTLKNPNHRPKNLRCYVFLLRVTDALDSIRFTGNPKPNHKTNRQEVPCRFLVVSF